MAIEHQRRRCVRDLSLKKSPHPGLAHIRNRACVPSTIISAADRATAANSQSRPPSRAWNSIFHVLPSSTNSSCPSVMRRIWLIGSAHSRAMLSFRTIAPKALRNASRRRTERDSRVCAASGSEPERAKRLAPRSAETICAACRKAINSSQDKLRAGAPGYDGMLAKSMASRPPSKTTGAATSSDGKVSSADNRLTLSRRLDTHHYHFAWLGIQYSSAEGQKT